MAERPGDSASPPAENVGSTNKGFPRNVDDSCDESGNKGDDAVQRTNDPSPDVFQSESSPVADCVAPGRAPTGPDPGTSSGSTGSTFFPSTLPDAGHAPSRGNSTTAASRNAAEETVHAHATDSNSSKKMTSIASQEQSMRKPAPVAQAASATILSLSGSAAEKTSFISKDSTSIGKNSQVAQLEPSGGDTKTQSKMSILAATPRKKKRAPPGTVEGQSTGRWTNAEHQAFLWGLRTYGREWKKVASHIPTRSSAQVRSHAQKYFAKIQREEESWAAHSSATTTGDTAPTVDGPASSAPANSARMPSAASTGLEQESGSIQANVARIEGHPETVQAEVEDTMRQLHERYRQLQRLLQQAEAAESSSTARKRSREMNGRQIPEVLVPAVVPDDMSSSASLSSLHNEELIALSVLQAALPNGDASLGSLGSRSMSEDDPDEEQKSQSDSSSNTDETASSKRPRQH